MAEISSENDARAFNYTRNTKNVLNISRLALLLFSLAKSLVFNRRNKHTMHCGTSMRTSPRAYPRLGKINNAKIVFGSRPKYETPRRYERGAY